MPVRHRTIGMLAALVLSLPAASSAQNAHVTWTEAVEYVLEHGSASSFYGPVAASLGLGSGTVNCRALSVAGNPQRDFYVTDNAVVLSVTWTSGAGRGYTASRDGVLKQALDRNRTIPLAQAAGAFAAEKQWWMIAISADKPKAGS